MIHSQIDLLNFASNYILNLSLYLIHLLLKIFIIIRVDKHLALIHIYFIFICEDYYL